MPIDRRIDDRGCLGSEVPDRDSTRTINSLISGEVSAINRLIVAEEDGPVERRYPFPVGILLGRLKVPPSSSDLGKGQRRERAPRSRYCLSHFLLRSTTSNRIGPMRARKPLCATARFACRIPSSVMGAGANRLMMSTTIGSGFAADFAASAARRSRSCHRSHRPTATTALSHAARRYSATSWKAVAAKMPHPPSRTRIAWRTPPPCADGSAIWIRLGRRFLLCAGRCWP